MMSRRVAKRATKPGPGKVASRTSRRAAGAKPRGGGTGETPKDTMRANPAGPRKAYGIGMVKGAAELAENIVGTAGRVLLEEIQAGVRAADEVSRNFAKAAGVNPEEQNELVEAYVGAAKGAAVIAGRLAQAGMKFPKQLTQSITTVGEAPPTGPASGKSAGLSTVGLGSVKPGGRGSVSFTLQNAGKRIPDSGILCTNLINQDGHQIPAQYIKCKPYKFLLPANGGQEVTISVLVPGSAAAGVYQGLLSVRNSPLKALVEVTVTRK